MKTQIIGKFGEDAAAEYLEYKDYEIIARNFSCGSGEIDIIARDGDTTVFAEVKTRSSDKYGTPAEAVGYEKQKKIKKTAMFFMSAEADMRFDVIEVYYNIADGRARLSKINHIKNAF